MSVIQGRVTDTQKAKAVQVDAQGRLVLAGTISATITGFATEPTLQSIDGKLPALVGGAIPVTGTFAPPVGGATELTLAAIEVDTTSIENKLGIPITVTDNVAPADSLFFGGLSFAFDGTNWDRVRAGIFGVTSTPAGYLDSLPFGRYVLAPPTLTDGQFQNFMLDEDGNLKVALSGSSAIGNLVIPTDGLTPTPSLEVASYNLVYDPVAADWNRAVSGADYTPADLTAVPASVPIAKYLATPPALTDNENHGLTLTTDGALRVSFATSGIAVADDTTPPAQVSPGFSFLAGFDGSTWDRLRAGFVSAITTAAGMLNTLPLAQYLATLPTITDTHFRTLLLDLNGRLHTRPYRAESYVVTNKTVSSSPTGVSTFNTVTLPAGIKSLAIRARNSDVDFDVAVGTAPTDTLKYVRVPAGSQFYLEDVNLGAGQAYFVRCATAIANQVISVTTTNGFATATGTFPGTVIPGQFIAGTGISADTVIATVSSGSISLQNGNTFASAPATASGTNSLTISGLVLEIEYTI